MSLQTSLLRQLDDARLTRDERARLRCRFAKELEEVGNYEAARSMMGGLWQRIGERPRLAGLEQRTTAEVLLRAGVLTGWIGSHQQIGGAQDRAKDLISESIMAFEALQESEKIAEALTELSVCYWREGAYDEARITLWEALWRLGDRCVEQRAIALLRSGIVELSAARYNDALQILTDAAPLFEASNSHSLKGRYHVNVGIILKELIEGEHREDYVDRALVEYAVASFHFEQAGHHQYCARVENNLGYLLSTVGRFSEAHEHLDRARLLFEKLKDSNGIAQVDEMRARTLLQQGRESEAEELARSAVRTLEKGDERALLARALIMHGTALARLGRDDESRSTLQDAIEVAHRAGALDDAGLAALTMIEELGESLTASEMGAIYERADHLLADSQHPGTLRRLRSCVRRVLNAGEQSQDRKQETGGLLSASPNFVYKSAQMEELVREAHRVASSSGPILLTGEVGTGKRMLARIIHEWSERPGEFVSINCAALGESLAGAQLFGDLKDSLAGALKEHPGAVRRATGGTLFLDEITKLSKGNQGKLLRLLEHGKVQAVGALQPERVDVRIIVATTRSLKEEVAQGRFREDLFYRLQTFHLKIPPLRERTEDIPVMAEHFIREALEQYGQRVTFTSDAIEALRRLPLRGNARELRALIERTVLMSPHGSEISQEAVETLGLRRTGEVSLADVWAGCSLEQEVLRHEGSLIKRALEVAGGSVTHAARLLGITHQGLVFILQGRQKELLSARTPARPRQRSLSGESKRKRR